MESPVSDNKQRRWSIFRLLAPYYGKVVLPSFLRKTATVIPEIERIHPLIEGIYKPAWSDLALSIACMLESPYADEVHYADDGRWWIKYSPKAGGRDVAQNAALFLCMKAHEPVLVLKQLSGKTSSHGARYRLLGLGMIQKYDSSKDVFIIQNIDLELLEAICADLPDEEIIEAAVRATALDEFSPFVREDKAIYKVSEQRRDVAFKRVVLGQYAGRCAVTGMMYCSEHHVEAQAAHIIPKHMMGSDDPRNGISLSRTLHWAFDEGLFTISDQYEVVVNKKALNADHDRFPILNMHGHPISRPDDEQFLPHPDALAVHKKEVFDKFRL